MCTRFASCTAEEGNTQGLDIREAATPDSKNHRVDVQAAFFFSPNSLSLRLATFGNPFTRFAHPSRWDSSSPPQLYKSKDSRPPSSRVHVAPILCRTNSYFHSLIHASICHDLRSAIAPVMLNYKYSIFISK